MFRKFILMLIVAVTLQFSWSVASAYCMHEADRTSQHFGHHVHQHDVSDKADADKNNTAKKAAPHPDCASCSASPSVTDSYQHEQIKPLLVRYQLSSPPPEPTSPYLGQPLPPKWMSAA
jgi:hypothetical protein